VLGLFKNPIQLLVCYCCTKKFIEYSFLENLEGSFERFLVGVVIPSYTNISIVVIRPPHAPQLECLYNYHTKNGVDTKLVLSIIIYKICIIVYQEVYRIFFLWNLERSL
jgi:hypothetical protein